jgi:hypothetical protein
MLRAATNSWDCMYWSMSWNPVISGAPSQITKSQSYPLNASSILVKVSPFVISPTMWYTLSIGAVYCKSTDTIRLPNYSCTDLESKSPCSPSFFLQTWLQLPGAPHRSTTRWVWSKMWNMSSICRSLYADRAL